MAGDTQGPDGAGVNAPSGWACAVASGWACAVASGWACAVASGWAYAVASGWGDHRLRCGDTEISFSGEPVGWQVSIEGPVPADVATRLVAAVAAQTEREVHQPIEWIRIS